MKKVFLTLLMASIFVGCASDSTDDVTNPPPAKITYAKNIKPLVDTSCATSGCHNAASKQAGLTLETYAQVKNAFLNGNAFARIESTTNPMPPSGKLPDGTIQTIKKWRDQGYLEK
ncbi:MAG: hypothetical protein HWD85_05140 [Flavobacteriaceae bacterium]|nr:hypothetical protein [Flavobacteriaceae bacterium]